MWRLLYALMYEYTINENAYCRDILMREIKYLCRAFLFIRVIYTR